MILTWPDLAILVTNTAIRQKDIAIGIMMAESGGRTDARNFVRNPGTKADGSWDRGIWQWNSYWHPEISDAEADDPYRATEHAAWVSMGGTQWTAWATFNHGSYLIYLPRAQFELAAIGE